MSAHVNEENKDFLECISEYRGLPLRKTSSVSHNIGNSEWASPVKRQINTPIDIIDESSFSSSSPASSSFESAGASDFTLEIRQSIKPSMPSDKSRKSRNVSKQGYLLKSLTAPSNTSLDHSFGKNTQMKQFESAVQPATPNNFEQASKEVSKELQEDKLQCYKSM